MTHILEALRTIRLAQTGLVALYWLHRVQRDRERLAVALAAYDDAHAHVVIGAHEHAGPRVPRYLMRRMETLAGEEAAR